MNRHDGSGIKIWPPEYGQTSENGGVVVIKKLLGTEAEDKRVFLKEAKFLHGLQNKNVVQFKAICSKPSAIMLEHLSFNFAPFGIQDSVNSLADFLLFVDGCEGGFEEFPFQNKIAHDICSGIAYLHDQGIAHRVLKPLNVLVSMHGRIPNVRYSREKRQRTVLKRLVKQGNHYLPLPEESYKKTGEY